MQLANAIALPITTGVGCHATTTITDLLVVRPCSLYNELIGRKTLNKMRAVTLTYHLNMNFLTNSGVWEVRGKQVLARECYIQELKNGGAEVHMAEDRENVE